MILLFIVVIFTVILLIVALVVAYDRLFAADAPQIYLEPAVITEVLSKTRIKPGSLFYDLGCGDGRVLLIARAIQPRAQYVGVEKALFPYVLARYKTRRYANITVIRGSIKNYAIKSTSPTIVFMYLLPKAVGKLSAKLSEQLGGRVQIISVAWPMPNLKDTKRIRLKSPSAFAKYWYVYTN